MATPIGIGLTFASSSFRDFALLYTFFCFNTMHDKFFGIFFGVEMLMRNSAFQGYVLYWTCLLYNKRHLHRKFDCSYIRRFVLPGSFELRSSATVLLPRHKLKSETNLPISPSKHRCPTSLVLKALLTRFPNKGEKL